ncbi:hypothetical protein B0F87_101433 [Methylobacter tundripaludum]|uniref:Uncharacterized protein n=1 Tax=Methylobacter tundripaludum TaxID=173365 RepID=A0A2S6HL13_9GAMM|nr:hypothetical protein B0F87_101433 [Methylobacter tundripaludum]
MKEYTQVKIFTHHEDTKDTKIIFFFVSFVSSW